MQWGEPPFPANPENFIMSTLIPDVSPQMLRPVCM